MKLFSNAERQHNSNVSFHYAHPDGLPEQTLLSHSNHQNHRPSNQFSLGPDPSSHIFDAIAKSDLFSQPSHICLQSGQEPGIPNNASRGQSRRSITPRKKIFDPENVSFPLKSTISEAVIASNGFKPTQSNIKDSSQGPKRKEYPSSTIQINTINIPYQPQQSPATVSQKRSTYKSKLPIKFQRQTDRSDKILTQPILAQETTPKQLPPNTNLHQTARETQYSRIIPSLVDRMDKNEREIAELKHMIKSLSSFEMSKVTASQRSMKRENELREREIRVREKEADLQMQDEKFRETRANRSSLQRQQLKRLQQLIEENRHLCEKVLQKRMRDSQQECLQDSKTLEQKIHRLKEQRQLMQRGSHAYNLHNLDISAIPYFPAGKHGENSQIAFYPTAMSYHNGTSSGVGTTEATRQGMESVRRRRGVRGDEKGVREVLRTKIY